jgi:uncharacterized integral membrane protein (TIGR00698 family)
VWIVLAVIVAAVFRSPVIALLAGAAVALTAGNPRAESTGRAAKILLQAAVVLLGFGLEIGLVLRVGAGSIGVTLATILATLALGFALGRMFGVGREVTTLLGSGTAICGGSAIAAVAPAIGASPAATAVSLAVVFLLNAVGLVVFPPIGHWAGMDQDAFGVWSALAIHDTSSVVGAAAVYGERALQVATTVKLTRALWILPLALLCARFAGGRSGAKFPWFLLGFLAAAVLASTLPGLETAWSLLARAGRFLMVVTLFLIGAGLTRASLRALGLRPLLMAGVLWVLVSAGSYLALTAGLVRIAVPD